MRKWLYLSVISFFISSMTIWFVSYVSFEGEDWQKILGFILGGAFWLGFIMGFVFLRPVGKKREADKKYTEKRGVAFFRFFGNKPLIVFDILLIISAVITAVSFAVPTLPQILSFGGVFGLVFSLEMHGVFSGNNYGYLRKKRDVK